MELFHKELLDLLMLVLTGAIGFISKYLSEYFKKKGIITLLQTHKELVELAVNGVEQAYKHLHGKEKLNVAKIEIIKMANERGIKISEKELDILIEAVVKQMNETAKTVEAEVEQPTQPVQPQPVQQQPIQPLEIAQSTQPESNAESK